MFSNTDDSGSLTISGGTFTGNYTEATGRNDAMEGGRNHGGGAVYVRRGMLAITGGTFEANEARGLAGQNTNYGGGGGAIYVANVAALPGMTKGESRFTLSGDATFTGNKSTSSGGAIMLSWNVQGSFKSGMFENNYAQDLGGAVYTEEASVSEFGRTAVFGNTAGHFGGGLWLCPSGQGVSSPSQSNLALFDNKAGDLSLDPDSAAHGTGAAGDDFALMYPSKKEVESSSVVLGDGWYSEAGVVTWYRDGQPLPKATGFGAMNTGRSMGKVETDEAFLTDPSVARYDEGDRTQVAAGRYVLEKHHGDAWKSDAGGLALKSVVADEAKGRAKAAASLTFTRKPSSATASLAASKTLVGGELVEGAFDFVLEERGTDGTYQEVQTVANKADGAISFDPMSYDEAGTHLLRIAERAGDAANITYDQAVYYAQVVVSEGTDEAGHPALSASVGYFADEECTQAIDAIEFVNTVSDQPPAPPSGDEPGPEDDSPADDDQSEASPHTGDTVLLQVCLALFALSATTVVVAARRMRV